MGGVIGALLAFVIRAPAVLSRLPAVQGLVSPPLPATWRKVQLPRFTVEALLCVVAGLGLSLLGLDENLASGLLFLWTGRHGAAASSRSAPTGRRRRRAGMTPATVQEDEGADRLIHEPARRVIMTILAAWTAPTSSTCCAKPACSKGNLSSHLAKLEAGGYVEIEKTFRGKVPLTICRMTEGGAGVPPLSRLPEEGRRQHDVADARRREGTSTTAHRDRQA